MLLRRTLLVIKSILLGLRNEWTPWKALLGQPQADLDSVFAAQGEADWFLGKAGAGARR